MRQKVYPVDVISVCDTGGQIRPLRIRLKNEDMEYQRIDIQEVVEETSIRHIGAEARIYLCKAILREREVLLKLKYSIRSHSWCLLGRMY